MAWLKLIQDFPDRFMVDSDRVGRFEKLEQTLRKYDPLLKLLPPEIGEKVASDNFLKVLPKRVLIR